MQAIMAHLYINGSNKFYEEGMLFFITQTDGYDFMVLERPPHFPPKPIKS